MKTQTLTIAAAWLYDRPDSYALVPIPGTTERVLVTKYGTFRVLEADNRFIRGERVPDGAAGAAGAAS